MRDVDQWLLNSIEDEIPDDIISALDAGADVNIRNDDGESALIWGARDGYVRFVDRLIQAGADIDIQAENGWTALIWAAYNGHTEIVAKLIQAGAVSFIKDKNDRNASDMARILGHIQTAELIEQRMTELKSAELAQNTEIDELHDMSRWL